MNLKLIIFYSTVWVSCCSCGGGNTKKIKSSIVNSNIYERDRLAILNNLNKDLLVRNQSFYSYSKSDHVVLILDTVLYSQNANKFVVFVLAKSPTQQQLVPNKKYLFYFNAYCYLGIKNGEQIKLKWMKKFSLTNYYDESEASVDLRKFYFEKLAKLKNSDGSLIYKYNVNDDRFWDAKIWDENFN